MKETPMDYSVVICTRNRAEQLAETLEAFTKLNIPPGAQWEFVVVDNGSTDNTAEIIDSFSKALPIRRVFEPKAGLSNARNAAIDSVKGRYMLWTDDDVIVDPKWMEAYAEAIREWPEAAVFGGKIIPNLQAPTPIWMEDVYDFVKDCFAARDFGDEPQALSVLDNIVPFGANFVLKTEMARQFRFDPMLGRAPGRNRGGEETECMINIMKAGHEGRWVPSSAVSHIIPPDRQTLDAIVSSFESQGEDWAHLRGEALHLNLLGIPVVHWIKLPICYIQFILSLRGKLWPFYLARLAWHDGVFKYNGLVKPFSKVIKKQLEKENIL